MRPAMVEILSLCPYIDKVFSNRKAQSISRDFNIPIMSLMHLFKTTIENIPTNIPYLYADPALVHYWNKKLRDNENKQYKIGINWKGTQTLPEKDLLPTDFLSLCEFQKVTLYSLQKNGDEELNLIPNCPIKMFGSFFDKNSSFMDTAAVMKNLDLFITSDTSVAHLAGGLGVKTWLLLPYVSDWRWLTQRTDTPWYPTMRLFRQPKPGDWKSVMDDVKNALQEFTKQN